MNKQQDRPSKLLIVDNADHVSSVLEELFSAEGFDTHSTWSGREALALIQSRPFDVLLVSDHLPDLYYGEFLKQASRQAAQPYIIVLHTGKPLSGDLGRYRRLGAAAVVDKTDPEQIRQVLKAQFPAQFRSRTSIN